MTRTTEKNYSTVQPMRVIALRPKKTMVQESASSSSSSPHLFSEDDIVITSDTPPLERVAEESQKSKNSSNSGYIIWSGEETAGAHCLTLQSTMEALQDLKISFPKKDGTLYLLPPGIPPSWEDKKVVTGGRVNIPNIVDSPENILEKGAALIAPLFETTLNSPEMRVSEEFIGITLRSINHSQKGWMLAVRYWIRKPDTYTKILLPNLRELFPAYHFTMETFEQMIKDHYSGAARTKYQHKTPQYVSRPRELISSSACSSLAPQSAAVSMRSRMQMAALQQQQRSQASSAVSSSAAISTPQPAPINNPAFRLKERKKEITPEQQMNMWLNNLTRNSFDTVLDEIFDFIEQNDSNFEVFQNGFIQLLCFQKDHTLQLDFLQAFDKKIPNMLEKMAGIMKKYEIQEEDMDNLLFMQRNLSLAKLRLAIVLYHNNRIKVKAIQKLIQTWTQKDSSEMTTHSHEHLELLIEVIRSLGNGDIRDGNVWDMIQTIQQFILDVTNKKGQIYYLSLDLNKKLEKKRQELSQ
jgi:hypothetical protein